MNNEKKYKLQAPIGNIIIPKEVMTEKELREFVPQLVQDAEQNAIWKEKAAKDPIESVVDWLRQAGYTVTEVTE